MLAFVKFLGIALIIAGTLYTVKVDIMKRFGLAFWKEGRKFYVAVFLNFLIGVLLLVAAAQCAVPWFVIVLGVISIIKGIALFTLGPEKIFPLIDKLLAGSPMTLRLFAISAIVIGVLLIVYAV